MANAQRVYRIERFVKQEDVTNSASEVGIVPQNGVAQDAIMNELADIKKLLIKQPVAINQSSSEKSADDGDQKETANKEYNEEYDRVTAELSALKTELAVIHRAIDETKSQILSLAENASDGKDMKRTAEELAAIVNGTEQATTNILSFAEQIDSQASHLSASLNDETKQAMALDIQDQVIKIFEACNFQDLTGQRITKVVKTFCYIEERIDKMMDIWGGASSFSDVETDGSEIECENQKLLNGPSLETDVDIASQSDIDALFG